jgi:hypothetical protein
VSPWLATSSNGEKNAAIGRMSAKSSSESTAPTYGGVWSFRGRLEFSVPLSRKRLAFPIQALKNGARKLQTHRSWR